MFSFFSVFTFALPCKSSIVTGLLGFIFSKASLVLSTVLLVNSFVAFTVFLYPFFVTFRSFLLVCVFFVIDENVKIFQKLKIFIF